MKKLFISCPMKGRTEEAIRESMDFMHKYAELMTGEELEVIPSYIEHKPPVCRQQSVWYLGESIKKMADADFAVCVSWSDRMFAGCEIEKLVANSYGIPVIEVEWRSAKCFADCVDMERHRWEICSVPCNKA